MFATMLYMQFK